MGIFWPTGWGLEGLVPAWAWRRALLVRYLNNITILLAYITVGGL